VIKKTDTRVLLAKAGAVLAKHGHADFNQGQVSARDSKEDLFLINRAERSFDELDPDSFVVCSIEGSSPRDAPPEAPLHSAIYAGRPDVRAIIHTHSRSTILFGATDFELRPISHDGAAFAGRLARYTDSSCTILDLDVGRKVALALGDSVALLLRNHGALVAARSVPEAAVLMIMLERACELELRARSIPGPVHISSHEDVREKQRFNFSPAALRSFWNAAVRNSERDRNLPSNLEV
jgi:L-fuculose-phosphate aldolase